MIDFKKINQDLFKIITSVCGVFVYDGGGNEKTYEVKKYELWSYFH